MAITDYTFVYGYDDNSTPADLMNIRRSNFEFAYRFGNPVLIKRIFNTDDVAKGNATWDETYDSVYGQGSTQGTDLGLGAGFNDGGFTYVTFGDALVDDDTPNRPGAFKQFVTTIVAPWIPFIADGDLIITCFVTQDPSDPKQFTITGTGDRFRVQKVVPVTIRSDKYRTYMNTQTEFIENLDIIVCQNVEAVRIPRSNPEYNVPLLNTEIT